MTAVEARRDGPGVVGTIATLVALAILVGLGTWQVQRLHWKEGVLARIHALQNTPPEPLDVVLRRVADGEDVDYTRVQAACPNVETTPFVRLWAVPDERSGYRIITGCTLSGSLYGSVLVDRGFIDEAGAATLAPGQGRPLDRPVTGVLRKGDPANFVTPPPDTAKRLWFARDIPAMATALGAPRPAPVFLMLETPAPKGVGPIPMAIPSNIPNNHLQYAVTWFGLAAALLGVYLASLWRGRSR